MSWLSVGGKDDDNLASHLEDAVSAKQKSGEYTAEDVKYVQKLSLALAKGELRVSDESLEGLRRLCQLWDVDIKVYSISSHRKIIGPVIVAVKKLVFPILRVLMKEFINQQRTFNAEVIAFLAHLSQQSKDDKK